MRDITYLVGNRKFHYWKVRKLYYLLFEYNSKVDVPSRDWSLAPPGPRKWICWTTCVIYWKRKWIPLAILHYFLFIPRHQGSAFIPQKVAFWSRKEVAFWTTREAVRAKVKISKLHKFHISTIPRHSRFSISPLQPTLNIALIRLPTNQVIFKKKLTSDSKKWGTLLITWVVFICQPMKEMLKDLN